MTDQEIILRLINRNNRITKDFFFVKCRPLFCKVISIIFDYEVNYDEFVNELYIYLMEDNAVKLRDFQYRSSVYQWLKVVAIRYFLRKREQLIDDSSHESLYEKDDKIVETCTAREDLERLFNQMPNKRYVFVIRKLILEELEPEELAQEMNITTANLYNIKRRAIAQLSHIALTDIKYYGK